MRDPTRGGLATVAHELARATGLTVRLSEAQIPVNESVQSVCELLGFDPLYLACEGRIVAVVASDAAEAALAELRTVAPMAEVDRRTAARGAAGDSGYGVRRPACARRTRR
jgi:hydrogenase expression/formation protein HypE